MIQRAEDVVEALCVRFRARFAAANPRLFVFGSDVRKKLAEPGVAFSRFAAACAATLVHSYRSVTAALRT